MKHSKVTARQITNMNGDKRWQFGTHSILHKGQISWSLNNWASKASALRAGRSEYAI